MSHALASTWRQAGGCPQHTEENCQDDQALNNFSPIAHNNSPYKKHRKLMNRNILFSTRA
jgi:hypothetical protein